MMAGPLDDLLPGLPTSVPSFFLGNAPAGSPMSYQGLQTRRAIVESMLKGRRPFPKTTGEGITAVGEALGERRALAQLDAGLAADEAATAKAIGTPRPSDYGPRPAAPPVAAPPVAAPTADAGSPVAVPAMSYAPTDDTNVAAAPGQETAIPGVSMAANTIPLPPPRPVYDRSRLNAEVAANPALTPRLLSMTRGEVGGNPFKQQVQAETPFNRATARDQSLAQVLQTHLRPGDAGYYPPETFTRGQASPDILRAVMRGSDLGGQALGFSPTGNASGGFAADRVARGVYGAHRGLGSGNNMETYVTQERPDQLARLAASRVPASFPVAAPPAADVPDAYTPAAPPPSIDAGPFVGGDTTAPAAVPGPDLAAPAPAESPYKGDRQSSATDGMGSPDDAMAFAPTDQSLALAAPTDQPAAPATNARDAITMALMAGQGGQRNLGAPRAVRDAAVAGGTTGDTARTAGVDSPFSGTDIAKLDAYGASGGTPQDTAGPGYAPPPPPTVMPDVVPAGTPKPVQVAANAAANPPTITDIGVAPAAAPATAPPSRAAAAQGLEQPLVSPSDFYSPPPKSLPPPPALRPILREEARGNAMITLGTIKGDPRLVAAGQQIVGQEKAYRDELYKQDVEKWNKDYTDTQTYNKAIEDAKYKRNSEAIALANAREGLHRNALPSQFGPTPAPQTAPSPAAPIAQVPAATQVAGPGVPAAAPAVNYATRNAQLHDAQTNGPLPAPAPPGQSEKAWAETQKTVMAKQVEAAQNIQRPLDLALNILNQARTHPGRASGVGFGGEIRRAIEGSPEKGFGGLIDQLKGINFMEGIGEAKATGANMRITQMELANVQNAMARINPNMNDRDLEKAFIDFENHAKGAAEQIQRQAGQPVTAWRQPGDNYSYAPDQGQVGMRTVNGTRRLMEYVGGNPKLDSSYKMPGQ